MAAARPRKELMDLQSPERQRKNLRLLVWILASVSFSPLLGDILSTGLIVLVVLLLWRYAAIKSLRADVAVMVLLFLFFIGSLYDAFNVSHIGDFSPLNIYFPACFFAGYLVARSMRLSEYLTAVEPFIFVTACLSLLGMLVISFAPALVWYLPEYSYYETTHRTAVVFNVLMGPGGPIPRNTGIASEPGAYQFLLNLALYAHIRYSNRFNMYRFAVYAAAIVLTQSTTGLLILVALTVYAGFRSKVALLIIPASIIAGRDFVAQEISYQIQHKWIGSSSFEGRFSAMQQTIDLAQGRFLGLGNSGYAENLGNFDPSWDSYGQILIRYGYPMLIAVIVLVAILTLRAPLLGGIVIATFFAQGIWFACFVTPLYFLVMNQEREHSKDHEREVSSTKRSGEHAATTPARSRTAIA
ncbi:hypothetical protein F7P69_24340 [Cellulosimicrobium funkei]|nr:hypothetical protein [Cellulosimicrobium funkei]